LEIILCKKKRSIPDQGNGRYSQKLTIKNDLTQNPQRIHQNFFGSVGIIIPATLIPGLIF